ncbi:MAG: phosphodiester glycosidase family protein [Fimbriimonadaceae bacterium]|nr:phosphodiester glycosidase family protein [Fimbriimonadaceae bacterium]
MPTILAFCAAMSQQEPDRSVGRYERVVSGARCDVIQVDMTKPFNRFQIVLARDFPNGDEPFSEMLARTPGVVAAMNGAYFDKETKKPIGDIWTDGALARRGAMGTAFCVKADRTMDIQRVVRHRSVDWSGFESVLACGPALVLDGEIDCDWQSEGFRDPSVTGRTHRMGIGYTSKGKLLMVRVTTSLTFEEFAEVMKGLGCYEAMNLDSGASRGFYHEKMIEEPGRNLTNVIAITKVRR